MDNFQYSLFVDWHKVQVQMEDNVNLDYHLYIMILNFPMYLFWFNKWIKKTRKEKKVREQKKAMWNRQKGADKCKKSG